MTRTFIQTAEFSKCWDYLGLDDDDLRRLEYEILSNPKAGPVIRGTGKLRKMRFAFDGRGKSRSARVCYVPVKTYSSLDIKRIRQKTGMSQKLFAGYMGVSVKAVEAWERGKNHPSGPASRLLSMMEKDPELTREFPFVQ